MRGIASFEIEAADPVAELGENADVAVAQDGTVFGLSSERGEVVTVPVDNEGEALEPSTASLGEVDSSRAAHASPPSDAPPSCSTRRPVPS